jgi:hypothetical protein
VLTGPPGTIHACKRVLPEEVYVSVGLRADLAIFRDSLQRELPDLLCEERSGFMPGRFIFCFALAVDSFPRITVADAFGRLNSVPVAAALSTSTSVTFADGTAAAEGSVTVPDTEPVYNYALAFGARPKKTRQAAESTNFVTKTTDPSLFVAFTPKPRDPIPFVHISMALLL